MKSRAKFCFRAFLAALFCACATVAFGQSAGKSALPVPIPVGQKASGVRIPYWDENGKLKMFFNIDEMLRSDPDHLVMTNAKIETYDDDGKPDITLLLPLSLLDLNTRMVSSNQPFVLKRTDFEMMGDTLQMDTVKQLGKVTGNIKVVIYNFGETAANKEQSK
jgi:hypothetical protein